MPDTLFDDLQSGVRAMVDRSPVGAINHGIAAVGTAATQAGERLTRALARPRTPSRSDIELPNRSGRTDPRLRRSPSRGRR